MQNNKLAPPTNYKNVGLWEWNGTHLTACNLCKKLIFILRFSDHQPCLLDD